MGRDVARTSEMVSILVQGMCANIVLEGEAERWTERELLHLKPLVKAWLWAEHLTAQLPAPCCSSLASPGCRTPDKDSLLALLKCCSQQVRCLNTVPISGTHTSANTLQFFSTGQQASLWTGQKIYIYRE